MESSSLAYTKFTVTDCFIASIKLTPLSQNICDVMSGLLSALYTQGSLVGVCGGVGSGKSSLLSALLGQVRNYIHYCSQDWGQ